MKKLNYKLEKMLRNIFDDDEFILGAQASLQKEELQEAFIDYINKYPDIKSDELCLMFISAHRGEYEQLNDTIKFYKS